MKLRPLLFAIVSLIAVAIAHAAGGFGVPGILNYQGRVSVKNVNFNGTGRFKFALVDGSRQAPTVTLWSNDGSSVAGSQPQGAVELPVSAGLYSVTLGDVELNNMTGIPAPVFQNPDVRLRVWFDDGVNGMQLLNPDQRIAAVGYAMAAENANTAKTATTVPDGAISAAHLKTVGPAPNIGQVLSYTADGLSWVNGGAGGGFDLPYSGIGASANALFSINNLHATAPDSWAIYGHSQNSIGVFGQTRGNSSGVLGRAEGPSGQAVFGYASDAAVGLLGVSEKGDGIVGIAKIGDHNGVVGRNDEPAADAGTFNASGGSGVFGYASQDANGVQGISEKGDGVSGTTHRSGKSGVVGFASLPDNNAVAAINGAGTGLFAKTGGADATAGFFWNSAGGDAVRTTGNVAIGGDLTTTGNAAINGTLKATGDVIARGVGNEQAYLGGDGNGDVEFGSKNPAVTVAAFYNPASGKLLDTLARDASVRSLTIYGGADLAEPFAMTEKEELPKGTVVVIDERSPGQLKQSAREYDTGVAGIVSGANGIHPGISLKQEGVNETGQQVALTGRVYCRADAAFGAIKPGDLLTTSGTPGHAMRVSNHERAQGAVLGKAMSPLTEGKGYVLVLVTLQ